MSPIVWSWSKKDFATIQQLGHYVESWRVVWPSITRLWKLQLFEKECGLGCWLADCPADCRFLNVLSWSSLQPIENEFDPCIRDGYRLSSFWCCFFFDKRGQIEAGVLAKLWNSKWMVPYVIDVLKSLSCQCTLWLSRSWNQKPRL